MLVRLGDNWECPCTLQKHSKRNNAGWKVWFLTFNPHLLSRADICGFSCEWACSLWRCGGGGWDSCLLVSLSKNDTNVWEDKHLFLCKSEENEKCHWCRHFTALHGFSCSFCLQMNRHDCVSTAVKCFSSHQHTWNTSYATSHWDFVHNHEASTEWSNLCGDDWSHGAK